MEKGLRSGLEDSASPDASSSTSFPDSLGEEICLRDRDPPDVRIGDVLSKQGLCLRAGPVFSLSRVGGRLCRPGSRALSPVPASVCNGGCLCLPDTGLEAPWAVGEESFLLRATSPPWVGGLCTADRSPGPAVGADLLEGDVNGASLPMGVSSFFSLTSLSGLPCSHLWTASGDVEISWRNSNAVKVS